jgi:hypothetical protein
LAARPIEVKYSVTRHRVTALAFDARWVRGAPGEASGGRWISWGDPLDVGVPAPYRAIVERILWGDRGRP